MLLHKQKPELSDAVIKNTIAAASKQDELSHDALYEYCIYD